MKKFRIRLYLLFLLIFLVSFGIFFGAFTLLSSNYIDVQAGNNFVYMADKVAVEFNLQVKREYEKFVKECDEVYTEGMTTKQLYDEVESRLNNIEIANVDTLHLGYATVETIEEEQTNVYYYKTSGVLKSYPVYKEYDYAYYSDKVSIYKLSYLLNDSELDKTTYIFYRYKDIFLYFDAKPYLDNIFGKVDGMPDGKFMIIQNGGNIRYEINSTISDDKFYKHISDGEYQTKYGDVHDKLLAGEDGFELFDYDDEKTFVVFSPLLKDTLIEPIFVTYKIKYDIGSGTMNYLKIILGIVFGTLFVILNLTFIISGIKYNTKEADVSLSRLNQYYIKPFAVMCNRKGKILSLNKTFRVNISDINKYNSVTDFELYDEIESILVLIKKQVSFTVITNNVDKSTMYIHFIPIKTGLKYCLLGENITDTVNEGLRNRQIALFNAVTNLPNKNLLDKSLHELVSTGDLYNNNYSLVAIDIVDFAKINRIFGFASADKMLQEFSKILEESAVDFEHQIFNIRTSLFMVLLKKVEAFNDVITWSKKCIATFAEPINIKDDYLTTVEVKMGIFNIEPKKMDSCDAFKIYECATTALDRAKNSRLTKCAIYSAEFGRMLTRDQIMEEDLRAAITNREFVMYYQAQYNTKYNRIAGFEALVRWNNPKYKLESVEHFISLAEKNGMIVDIGRIIIDETFRFVKSIEHTGIHISMNVSPVQLLQSGFVNDLISSYDEYKIKPGSVAVEITETFLMENSDAIIAKLKLLREKGFAIHLDDFGIGYSSMLYLKDLPVDVIKIDKEFVKHILNDKFSKIIVSKVVQIALNLNLDIIAEGVETEKQSLLLSKMGCNIIQGYLISKPIPEDEARKLISKYAVKQQNEKGKIAKNATNDNDDSLIVENNIVSDILKDDSTDDNDGNK